MGSVCCSSWIQNGFQLQVVAALRVCSIYQPACRGLAKWLKHSRKPSNKMVEKEWLAWQVRASLLLLPLKVFTSLSLSWTGYLKTLWMDFGEICLRSWVRDKDITSKRRVLCYPHTCHTSHTQETDRGDRLRILNWGILSSVNKVGSRFMWNWHY